MEQVVLVDEQDNELGLMDKLEAHRGRGRLHRAISVLLYRKKGAVVEVLLQKRSQQKPLWPLYWSNTCCSHPRKGESYIACGVRRFQEELGIELKEQQLQLLYTFVYHAQYNAVLSEYELDGMLLGEWDGTVRPNAQEVAVHQWMSLAKLQIEIKEKPQQYVPWLKLMCQDERLKKAIV